VDELRRHHRVDRAAGSAGGGAADGAKVAFGFDAAKTMWFDAVGERIEV